MNEQCECKEEKRTSYSFGFKVIVEADYACFTRPEMKVERVSYDVPTPSALEGLLKSVYWKPSIRYVIDKIVVFNPINFVNIRRNEVKDKIILGSVKKQMLKKGGSPCIYTAESRSQRASMILKDVKYGIEFHYELTGIRSENEPNGDDKHCNIIRRRLENGQHFRTPCMGCSEFPVKKLYLVEKFELDEICDEIKRVDDNDLGFMLYGLRFIDKSLPKNGDWIKREFSDAADAVYYRPHMIGGVIDVKRYAEEMIC